MSVPRRLEHPYENVPVLDWWKHDYDHVFVVLNPFFHVPGYSPETAAYGPTRHIFTTPQELLEEGLTQRENAAAEGFEDMIKQFGSPVRWEEVASAIGARDFRSFARTVWLSVIAGDLDEHEADLADRLRAYCHEAELYQPEEDVLPAILEPALAGYLAALGIEETTLWSEWRDVSRPCPAARFAHGKPATCLPDEKLSAIAAPGMLLSWGYDDVAGLLALSDKLRSRADPSEHFEGFWASVETTSIVFAPEGALESTLRN